MNKAEPQILSLQELQLGIKEAVQINFPDYVWVHAELSEVNIARNGHCYIELIQKEKEQVVAKIRATIWSFTFRMLKPYFESSTGYEFSSGIKVSLKVLVEFHEVYGLSLNVKDIDPNYTVGDVELQKRKILNRLEEEGVLGMNAELELPDVIQNIAIISSPTAAGFGDWKNQIEHNQAGYRFNYQLFEAQMQGQETGVSIVAALDRIYQEENKFDAVVIIRGGGSKSDLAGFDNYELAANIAQFPLPIITGIGHERDESIADIVAHTSLKTPTAVADFLIDGFASFEYRIDKISVDIVNNVNAILEEQRHELSMAVRNIHQIANYKIQKNNDVLFHSAKQVLRETHNYNKLARQTLHSFAEKLNYESSRILRRKKEEIEGISILVPSKISLLVARQHRRLNYLEQLSNALNPQRVLERGFAIIEQEKKIITSTKSIDKEKTIKIRMKDGDINVLESQ